MKRLTTFLVISLFWALTASAQIVQFSGAAPSVGGSVEIMSFGQKGVTINTDSGNANVLSAQLVEVPFPGELQSFSFYVDTAVGQLRLGIYDATGPSGGPGTLIVESGEFTPTTGLNVRTVSGTIPSAGNYWLAHAPSSNSLVYRAEGEGSFRSYSRTYAALPSTFQTTGLTSGITVWYFYLTMEVSAANYIPGYISHFTSTPANWTEPSIIDGENWYNHLAGEAYSLTQDDTQSIRFELRQGDGQAVDVGGERAEISSGFGYLAGDLIDVQFEVKRDAGDALGAASWRTLLQIHGDLRTAIIGMDGNKIFLDGNIDGGSFFNWTDTPDMVRGQWYKMRLQIMRGVGGWLKFWLDDVLVVDHVGTMTGTDNYVKLGVYRGEPGAVTGTEILHYRKIVILDTDHRYSPN